MGSCGQPGHAGLGFRLLAGRVGAVAAIGIVRQTAHVHRAPESLHPRSSVSKTPSHACAMSPMHCPVHCLGQWHAEFIPLKLMPPSLLKRLSQLLTPVCCTEATSTHYL